MNIFKNCRRVKFSYIASMMTLAFMVAAPIFFVTGCQSTPTEFEDTRTINQLIIYLKKSGLTIDTLMRNVRYQAILADDGAVMVIEGANIEFYLYNMKVDYQANKLLKVKKQGYIMVLGNKVPAITNGHFVMLTYSENPNKVKTIRAFKKYKKQ